MARRTANSEELNPPLKVAILWHMHQPEYLDPVSGETLLPWTWLHAVKDYGEMLKTVAETGVRVTVNLVPTLIEQLQRYVEGEDRDCWVELLSRSPETLDLPEREFILKQFFSVNEESHILPYPRYRQLYRRRGNDRPPVEEFSVQDLRDLQVWFLLAWSGYHLRREAEIVGQLLDKGEQFSEEEKQKLLACYHEEVAGILPLHRRLEEEGLIEVSVTPYAHPILPLLCNLQTASEPTPNLPLPAAEFHHPEDARLQVREGLRLANQVLGQRHRGMWPAEGAVSEQALKLMAEEGALWAASDEDILRRSLDSGLSERRRLYQIYQYGGLPLVFRDRELSDRIGFVYAGWSSDQAVADVLSRLRKISDLAPGGTVAIILDGENCWERYDDNGYPFLRDLYQTLLRETWLQPMTVSGAIAENTPEELPRLAAGSWIRSDFTTWIGHPEENLAWELLQKTRSDVIKNEIHEALAHPDEPLSDLVRQLLRAEGSDWFWWFGDEHVTAQADIFDRLFRNHLEAVYHLGGMTSPARLHQWIKTPRTTAASKEPGACFSPQINGRRGDYFEWLAAGEVDLAAGGAMYVSRDQLQTLLYGYDHQQFYFRFDQPELIHNLAGPAGSFEIRLAGMETWHLKYILEQNQLQVWQEQEQIGTGLVASDQVLEIAVPLEYMRLQPGESLSLSCHALGEEQEHGRWPSEGSARVVYRGAELDEDNWSI